MPCARGAPLLPLGADTDPVPASEEGWPDDTGTDCTSTHFTEGVEFPDDNGVGHDAGEIPDDGVVVTRAPRSETTRSFDGVVGSVFGEPEGPPGVLSVERLYALRPAPPVPRKESSEGWWEARSEYT